MKFNKWTLSLVGIGAVSLASAVRADEAVKLVPLNTLVPSTTISGYVDTAVQYNLGNWERILRLELTAPALAAPTLRRWIVSL